jgi:radical SAM protein with 4Fe4S-binding SPASM domain
MVYVNGDVTTCCLDQHLENNLGNLTRESLQVIWHGPTNHGWRVSQVQDDYGSSGPYCSSCNWRSAGAMPHDKVVEYLKKTGEDEACSEYIRRWNLDERGRPRG